MSGPPKRLPLGGLAHAPARRRRRSAARSSTCMRRSSQRPSLPHLDLSQGVVLRIEPPAGGPGGGGYPTAVVQMTDFTDGGWVGGLAAGWGRQAALLPPNSSTLRVVCMSSANFANAAAGGRTKKLKVQLPLETVLPYVVGKQGEVAGGGRSSAAPAQAALSGGGEEEKLLAPFNTPHLPPPPPPPHPFARSSAAPAQEALSGRGEAAGHQLRDRAVASAGQGASPQEGKAVRWYRHSVVLPVRSTTDVCCR